MTYRCPVCGIADATAYLRCYLPDCTDGRDQYRAPDVEPTGPVHCGACMKPIKSKRNAWPLLFKLLCLAAAVLALFKIVTNQ